MSQRGSAARRSIARSATRSMGARSVRGAFGVIGVIGVMTALVASTTPTRSASAQEWLISGLADVGGGLEGGGPANAHFQRARTTVRAGFELRSSEAKSEIWSLAARTELEPHTSFAVEGRYEHLFGKFLVLGIGANAIVLPESMFGITASASYRKSLGKGLELALGPELDVYVFGSDLPDKKPIWQLYFFGGLRAEF
jgi:hypothetical protein